MKNTGKEYEYFVANLQQAIMNTEMFTTQKTIKVEVNKILVDNRGLERQFDIYWEYDLGGFKYKTVIECKDYESRVSIDKIDALIGKTKDMPDLKLVFATKKGYQAGAKIKADQNKISLLIVREQNESDWENEDGNPLIKEIIINLNAIMPARIHRFEPFVDRAWIEKNSSFDLSKPITIEGQNNNILIEDMAKNETYSILELANSLNAVGENKYGRFEIIEKFEDAYISHSDLRVKIAEYKIEYSIAEPHIQEIKIDFSKELIGVIEYLEKGTKKSIFTDGRVKEIFDSRIK